MMFLVPAVSHYTHVFGDMSNLHTRVATPCSRSGGIVKGKIELEGHQADSKSQCGPKVDVEAFCCLRSEDLLVARPTMDMSSKDVHRST